MHIKLNRGIALVGALALMSTTLLTQPIKAKDGDWLEYNGDKSASRYLANGLATKKSVKNMKVVWRFKLPDHKLSTENVDFRTWVNETTPLAIDGVLYTSSGLGLLAAIDGKTGKEIWSFDPGGYENYQMSNLGYIQRGVTHVIQGGKSRILAPTANGYLILLDAKTGEVVKEWGENGRFDMAKNGTRRPVARDLIMTDSPPVICGGNIIPSLGVFDSFATGAVPHTNHPQGDIVGIDIETGKRNWIFHNPPLEGELGHDTWGGGAKWIGGANMWARATCDDETGTVFAPFSSPTNDFAGEERPGNNLFSQTLVAIDAKTGKRNWHFQFVRHDLLDYDLPTGPNLLDITVKGKKIKAAVQLTKQGFVYAFDRVTGKPIWPIKELPIPAGSVKGEYYVKSQPIPSHPKPYSRQGAYEKDLVDYTPELRKAAKKIFSRYCTGDLFTPPCAKGLGTLMVPGVLGGVSWAGAAHNPKTGIMYIPEFTSPFGIKAKKLNKNTSPFAHTGTWHGVGGPDGLPLFKPPYSTLNALDMNTGEYLWRVPAGRGPINHPAIKKAGLKAVGVAHQSFIAITDDIIFLSPNGDVDILGTNTRGNALIGQTKPYEEQTDPHLYAYDAKTGKMLSHVKLPVSGAFGGIITYKANGKQYVAVPVGGAGVASELVGIQVSD